MDPEKNICRHSSQKQPKRRDGSSHEGQEAGPDLLGHQLLIPRLRKSLPLLGPFPHPPWGQGLSFSFMNWGGGEMEEGLCVAGPHLWGEQEEAWEREARGSSVALLLCQAGCFLYLLLQALCDSLRRSYT